MEENKTNQTEINDVVKKVDESKDAGQVLDISNYITPIVNLAAAFIIGGAIIYAATMVAQSSSDNTVKITEAVSKIQVAGGTQAANAEVPAVKVTEDQINSIMTSTSLTFGNKDAKLKFVEFTDPSCPYCHIANGENTDFNKTGRFATVENGGTYIAPVPEMKKLVDAGKASMTIVFTVGHGAGEVAMQGWYCANEKGKFWEVHSKSMSKEGYDAINNTIQNNVENASKFAELTKDIVDPTFMTDCIKSGKYASKITEGQQIASSFGVQGTPGFFINTTPFNGAYSWNDMKSVAESLL